MGPLDLHLQRFKQRYPEASWTDVPGAGTVVTVPAVPLPGGWSKPTTTVRFLVPNGYPYAKLDSFWTDSDLLLLTGARPQNTGASGPSELAHLLWFSWHTDHWSASRDDMLTWMTSIRERLNRVC